MSKRVSSICMLIKAKYIRDFTLFVNGYIKMYIENLYTD